MPAIGVEKSEIARMMRMRTVANMTPAIVEDKCGLFGAFSFLFRLANGFNCRVIKSLTQRRYFLIQASVDQNFVTSSLRKRGS